MRRTLIFIVISIFLLAAYIGWNRYGFLMESLPETDVSGITIEDGGYKEVGRPIDLGFLEPDTDKPEIDLDFSLDDGGSSGKIDLSFLLEGDDPVPKEKPVDIGERQASSPRSTAAIESVVADFLDVNISQLEAMKLASENPVCIFDPVGQGGDIHEMVRSFQRLALGWGVKLDIQIFNSEAVIVDSFKAGRCDAIAVTGMKARPFNRFAATIEAVAGMPDYRDLSTVLEYLTQPEIAARLREGEYEVAGIFPIGNVYTFVRDGAQGGLDMVFQGRKVGVYDSDGVSLEMIRRLGATPVLVDSSSFAGKFNNGAVDIIFAPSVAYEPMELYRGLGRNGRIVDYPLVQLTYQFIIRHEKFPEGFAELLREAAYKGRGFAMEYVHLTEKRIPDWQWYKPDLKESAVLQRTLLDAQEKLAESGVYDGFMLKLMRKARCKREPTHYECVG